ncbi:MAG: enoyl-CoA hydratase-related protein [Candidatus Neomarinimicrobiota bacterium]
MNYIKFTTESLIRIITIDRTDALNAMNLTVIEELHDVIQESISSKKVGVVIITGSGNVAFIAGADIKSMQTMSPSEALIFSKKGQVLTKTIESSPKPMIAAINGFALGGGCEISLACHIRIAADNAKFSQPEVKLGIIPGWGGTQRLARIIGSGLANELILTGQMISADKALKIGLVNAVVHQKDLIIKTKDYANEILKNGPLAIKAALKCINRGSDMSIDEGLDLESNSFASLFDTKEQIEGTTAFLEKRKPNFRD